ncbi:MAG: rRNA maturation RNase YbeY [Candidatus Obscuribacterales bacterium]|nr:rRNA maturation RNase YbeY [Candidatus Obscuribacterales bacterium]
MAPQVSVSNRQRRHSVNLTDVDLMARSLAAQVCRNLKDSPCDWLSKSNVKEIEGRGEFSLVLVSDKKIRELNRLWRGFDKATDVLSFPMDTEPPPADEPYELGEIIVSLDTAKQQAEDLGHGIDRELAFLIVHGMLHVLGFDHESKEEEKEMFGRQRKILQAAGYPRM